MIPGAVFLAPMEGLADHVLRDVLTRVGGYSGAVTEFVRVSGTLLPLRTFHRICPELSNASRTHSGTPVVVQLLGSDPVCLAENAAQLASLSPAGVDLNFGCPAPTVNRHGGGAVLLDDPESLFRIAESVRRALPPGFFLSAKMRLGVSDTSKSLDCARALAAGGIDSLVVHARTREEGYRPPAHWEWVARIADSVHLPVTANGEVWTSDDYVRCRSVSGAQSVMVGRGAVADPFLARRIRARIDDRATVTDRSAEWTELRPLMAEFWRQVVCKVEPRHAPGRLKLWLASLQKTFVEAAALYAAVRTLRGIAETSQVLAFHGVPVSLADLPQAVG